MNKTLLALFVFGCASSSATPKGTEILSHPVFATKELTNTINRVVVLKREGQETIKLALKLNTTKHPPLKITHVAATVVENGGWTVSQDSIGEQVNFGQGENNRWGLPLLIQSTKSTACKSNLNTFHITAFADGEVEID